MNYIKSYSKSLGSLKVRGFTLIELMITVAIVGILASIAFPSYQNQVRKSRRSEAVAEISKIQQAQERWRANCPTYSESITAATTGCVNTSGLNITSVTDARYTYTLSNVTNNAYLITATAVTGSSQASDTNCTSLTVNVNNGTATNAPVACWSK